MLFERPDNTIDEDEEMCTREDAGLDGGAWALGRRVAQGLKQCACRSGELPTEVRYVWVYWDKERHPALHHTAAGGLPDLTKDDWLGILDECAAMGAEEVTFSVGNSTSPHADLWDVCHWAQDILGLHVGLHFSGEHFDDAEIEGLRRLDPARTRLFVHDSCVEPLRAQLDAGMQVMRSDFTPSQDERPACTLPKNMVFVNAAGQLYSCAYVHGRRDYDIGNAFEKPLDKRLCESEDKRTVSSEVPYQAGGCDGCPPLIAQAIARGDI